MENGVDFIIHRDDIVFGMRCMHFKGLVRYKGAKFLATKYDQVVKFTIIKTLE